MFNTLSSTILVVKLFYQLIKNEICEMGVFKYQDLQIFGLKFKQKGVSFNFRNGTQLQIHVLHHNLIKSKT